ncbi:uncharacterized protein LOC120099615 [Rattus norvegicus]|uniref:uncharacterized protein LOC120099615 n=1 Tax=Rattus norvegicus TaxID=10116 RepID=UPI002FD86EC0
MRKHAPANMKPLKLECRFWTRPEKMQLTLKRLDSPGSGEKDPLCPASFLLARHSVGHLVPETREKDLIRTSGDPLVTRRIQNCRIMKIHFGFRDDLLGISRQKTKKMTTLVILMLIQGVPIKVQSELRWGIMSTFPLPMPVMYNAQVFPRFFTTNKELGLAYLPLDSQIEQVKKNRIIPLKGSLCFGIFNKISSDLPCIMSSNQSSAWLREATWGAGEEDIVANATVLYGWWPYINSSTCPLHQPKLAPFCRGTLDEKLTLPWTGCQSRDSAWAVQNFFSFSPDLGGRVNFNTIGPRWSNNNPFDQWMLCGVNGSCTDLTPMAMLLGGKGEKGRLSFSWTGNIHPSASVWIATRIKYKPYWSTGFNPAPVCVWPPFVWIISNATEVSKLNCTDGSCFYALCWDASQYPIAVVTHMPRFIPVPVETPGTLTLFRGKRYFGISAIIVGIIATTAVAASVTASALDLSNTVQTTQTINDLSATISVALDRQASANTQIQGGLMLVNQRIDLVQEQLDILWQLAQLGCELKLPGLCVTSIQYEQFTKAANLSKTLSQHLLQN